MRKDAGKASMGLLLIEAAGAGSLGPARVNAHGSARARTKPAREDR